MWEDCPRVLEQPVKILGLEIEDFALVGLTPFVAGIWLDAGAAFLATAVVGLTFYFAKRGKPAGHVQHVLHRLELIRMPGILGPKERCYSPW
jgi:hypothetical protein